MLGDDPIKGGVDTAPASAAPVIPEDAAEDDAANLVEAWFFENFEDPARGMPRNGHDDGFYFTHGGPYAAADILFQVFQNRLTDSEINYLASQIDRDNDAWVPSAGRRLPPDEDEGWNVNISMTLLDQPTPADAYSEMLSRIEVVERALAVLDDHRAGIGHNQPPGPIDDLPLPPIDREEIGRALAVLKSQTVRPESKVRPLILRAIGSIKTAADVAGQWLAAKGDIAADEFAKSFGKTTGEMAAYALPGLLSALLAAATKWIGLW